MHMAKDKHVVVGADFAGFPLKEAVKEYLETQGWTVEDLTPELESAPMFQRVGFLAGSKLAEGEYEKALVFCGTGMGIHIAASKVPHVHAAVAESIQAARRAATGNKANLLAMGAFWTGPGLGKAMADAFLTSSFCEGYEDWEGFDEYHEVGWAEVENFDYEAYKANASRCRIPRFPSSPRSPTTDPSDTSSCRTARNQRTSECRYSASMNGGRRSTTSSTASSLTSPSGLADGSQCRGRTGGSGKKPWRSRPSAWRERAWSTSSSTATTTGRSGVRRGQDSDHPCRQRPEGLRRLRDVLGRE